MVIHIPTRFRVGTRGVLTIEVIASLVHDFLQVLIIEVEHFGHHMFVAAHKRGRQVHNRVLLVCNAPHRNASIELFRECISESTVAHTRRLEGVTLHDVVTKVGQSEHGDVSKTCTQGMTGDIKVILQTTRRATDIQQRLLHMVLDIRPDGVEAAVNFASRAHRDSLRHNAPPNFRISQPIRDVVTSSEGDEAPRLQRQLRHDHERRVLRAQIILCDKLHITNRQSRVNARSTRPILDVALRAVGSARELRENHHFQLIER
mmetsp:Transcript_26865/g.70623  ORF Transcript_26865/g.70623 Transcript_26865/m.70623 type:complete len:261 (-) Transcript_26865:60-842(-)